MDWIVRRRIEAAVFLIVLFGGFGGIGYIMGVGNMLNTIMRTAHDLLLNTVFYIMGITVLAGAMGKLMVEFGVVRLMEVALKPLMKPIFGLPGVASLGSVMTFFSDNPAIISLAKDDNFKKYFSPKQLISLTNFGTAFGMGLVVITFMSTLKIDDQGSSTFIPAMIGLCGAVVGAGVSTRLMQYFIGTRLKNQVISVNEELVEQNIHINETEELKEPTPDNTTQLTFKSEQDSVFIRFLNAILDGGKQGVDLAIDIIPGVLIISSMIMLITFDIADPSKGYQGLAYEGVPLLPFLAGKVDFIFSGLFGFETPQLVAFPITALGAVGAAMSMVKAFIEQNIIGGNEIAVFTAMGMCWSGFLSTHTAMLDALGHRELTSKALISHAVGGIMAGTSAHFVFLLYTTVVG